MKKIFYLLFFTLAIFAGCKKSPFEPIFDKPAEERLGDSIAFVSNTLVSAPNGWVVTLPTFAGGGYGFYMNFTADQKVMMLSDILNTSSTTGATSTYRVTTGLGANLIFDTYNFISLLQDPANGERGKGFSSDVEFTYVRSTADSLIMVGRQFRQPLILVKATAAQKEAYAAGDYTAMINKTKTFFAKNTFKYFELVTGSTTTKVGVNPNLSNSLSTGKRMYFESPPVETFVSEIGTEKIAFSLDGISILNGGFTYQGLTFVKLVWKDATTLAIYDSTGKEYIIKESSTPVIYSSVTVADATTGPGWGSDFIARRAQANATTLAGSNKIRLGRFIFKFDASANKMDLAVNIFVGTTSYNDGVFPYSYVKNDDGNYQFSAGTPRGNGSFIASGMDYITTQRLNVDTFTLDYYTDPVSGAKLGRFKSIEHPDFTFTGTLQ